METSDLDRQLDELVAEAPWAPLPSWPDAASAGDAQLDDALRALGGPAVMANAAVTRLLAATGTGATPALSDALWSMLEAATPRNAPFAGSLASLPTAELRARAQVRLKESQRPRYQRAAAVQRILAVLEGLRPADFEQRCSDRIERPESPVLRMLLARSLLGDRCYALPESEAALMTRDGGRKRDPSARADAAHLSRLAAHLRAGDPLVGVAAEAAWVLDPATVYERVRHVVASSAPAGQEQLVRDIFGTFFDGFGSGPLSFDEEPGWAELFAPVAGPGNVVQSLAYGHVLTACKTSVPLLSALRSVAPMGLTALFADLLDAVRALDDPGAATPLEALAQTLPASAGTKSPFSREGVLLVVKRLRRKRAGTPSQASFAFTSSVGTDGGPIVVLPASQAAAWGGASATYGTPDHIAGAYDAAVSAAADADFVSLDWGGALAVVIGAPQVSIALVKDGLWLVVGGSELDVELAGKERRGRKKWKRPIEIGDGGLIVLDAAMTVARAPEDALARVALAPGFYAVEAQTASVGTSTVSVLRLKGPKG